MMKMKNDTHPPFWNYAQIKNKAESFLKKIYPSLKIPVPIEELVEITLKIKLITVPNLKKDFGIDGFINSNFDAITIDDYSFNRFEERSRFTIAHELGHLILHKNIYSKCNFDGLDGYIEFQNKIPKEDLHWLDIQANNFAGCFLAPSARLKEEFNKAREKAGLPTGKLEDYSLPFLENLPSRFNVSPDVLMRQIQKEGLLG